MGIDLGLVRPATAALFETWMAARARATALLDVPVARADYATLDLTIPGDGAPRRRLGLLRFAGAKMVRLAELAPELAAIDPTILSELADDAHYAPYVARQEAELRALAANEAVTLDPALDYAAIGGLSSEMVERLSKARPETLGQAARIDEIGRAHV